MNCPICQKAGISDDAKFCPQCNSDLSQLVLLTQLESKLKVWNKRKLFLIIGGCLVIIGLVSVLVSNKLKINRLINNNQFETVNKDSLDYYRDKYVTTVLRVDSLRSLSSNKILFNYKVKKGDTLSKIALLFYGDINKADKIAEDNGLIDINLITINQILKIEIIR